MSAFQFHIGPNDQNNNKKKENKNNNQNTKPHIDEVKYRLGKPENTQKEQKRENTQPQNKQETKPTAPAPQKHQEIKNQNKQETKPTPQNQQTTEKAINTDMDFNGLQNKMLQAKDIYDTRISDLQTQKNELALKIQSLDEDEKSTKDTYAKQVDGFKKSLKVLMETAETITD